jgi:trimeric autotransporter adhesin
MKMKLLLVLMVSISAISFAQVGIGTTTPNGALDVSSTTQGFLLPRVALTASNVAAPVVNPAGGALANGTLVYNTATAGVFPNNVLPGYYYWNGSQWIRLNADASWITHGNSGTDASINFIGTTDNVDLVFRRNNLFSGRLNTSNTSFGVESLSNAATIAQRTVAIGVNALKNLTSGNDNIAVGFGSLEANTTGMQNIAIGTAALSLNSSGSYNTAIGYEVLTRNTTGILNTAVGNTSLYNNLDGNNNVGLGYATLQRNFSGSRNVAVGTNALFNNQSGNNNVGVGDSALESNTSGSNNVAVGRNSLFNNQSTSNNTSVGTESQLNNITGQNNTSLGYRSLFTNSGGSNNTAIGNDALYSNMSGSRNVVLGENAGYNITSGNNNTFIGYNTGTTISTGSNNTIIGSNVSLPAATSNNIVLADGAGNRRINVDQNGNVGIGTTTPSATLTVGTSDATKPGVLRLNPSATTEGGEINIAPATSGGNTWTIDQINDLSAPRLRIFSGGSGENGISILDNGNVGVGVTLPSQKFHIQGNVRLTGEFFDGNNFSGVAGQVLSNDGTKTTWVNNLAITPTVVGILSSVPNNNGLCSANFNTGTYIDLPVGKWSVQASFLLNANGALASGQGYWVRCGFSTSSSSFIAPNYMTSSTLISGSLVGPVANSMATGTVLINNDTSGTQRLYLWRLSSNMYGAPCSGYTLLNFGNSLWGENNLIAYPIN